MSPIAELRCRCGSVTGRVSNAAPSTVNRMICYCDDCQAYLHHLRRSDLLDAHGGTDIVQVAPASLRFERGREHIVALRLSSKGLYRWYASCCHTPIGNTLSPGIPFVGIVVQAFEGGASGLGPDDYFGRPVAGSMGKFAVGTPPEGSKRPSLRLIARALRLVLGWRLGGRTWPHPFFERQDRAPAYPVTVLTREQRDALRPLCGPRPTLARDQQAVASATR